MILALFDPPSDFEQRVRGIAPEEDVVRGRTEDPLFGEVLRRADVIIGRPSLPELRRAPALKWVQLSSAGADQYVGSLREDVLLTAANGVYGVPTSEHVMALMLALSRRIPEAVRHQGARRWQAGMKLDELHGRTCGILGLGDIGSEVARRAKAFGMRVLGMRRRPGTPPDFADAVYGVDGLNDLLAESDHVVNVLPGTDATHHLIDATGFGRMKSTAFLINVGRGSTVDEKALIHALESRRIAGAALDVFEEEPLSDASPLWEMENVLITPHCGGSSPREDARVADLFLDNLRCWKNGKDLLNVVDRRLGY